MKRTRKKQFRIPVTLALFCIAIIAVVLLFRTGNYPEAQPSIPLPVSGAQAEWNEMEKQSDTAWIDVPYLSQQNVLPTGCELVSAVMVLNYYGYKIDPITFAELVPQSPVPYDGGGYYIGSDPNEAFLGDPRTNHAYGCYAPVIVNAMNCIANENHIAQNTTGLSLDALEERYLQNGVPVLVWVTINMAEPRMGDRWVLETSGELFTWTVPEHCMVLIGCDRENYYLQDPYSQNGTVCYPKALVASRYNAFGQQSVVFLKK